MPLSAALCCAVLSLSLTVRLWQTWLLMRLVVLLPLAAVTGPSRSLTWHGDSSHTTSQDTGKRGGGGGRVVAVVVAGGGGEALGGG